MLLVCALDVICSSAMLVRMISLISAAVIMIYLLFIWIKSRSNLLIFLTRPSSLMAGEANRGLSAVASTSQVACSASVSNCMSSPYSAPWALQLQFCVDLQASFNFRVVFHDCVYLHFCHHSGCALVPLLLTRWCGSPTTTIHQVQRRLVKVIVQLYAGRLQVLL